MVLFGILPNMSDEYSCEYTEYTIQILSLLAETFVSIFLIVILWISLLVSDTKYWNEYISDTMKSIFPSFNVGICGYCYI